METWTIIIGIVAALAWMPFIIEIIKPIKINGKLFSIYGNFGDLIQRKRLRVPS